MEQGPLFRTCPIWLCNYGTDEAEGDDAAPSEVTLLSTAFSQIVGIFDRIPHIGFFAGWLLLALLLACALVYV
jgi:hypothetical protein